MQTGDSDWGRIYPNIITWLAGPKGEDDGVYHMLSWVRFWRNGNEYQLPVRMDVENVKSFEDGARYDEQFHTHCLKIIRFGKTTGDFKEPIKLNDKHVITIDYTEMNRLDIVEEKGL